MSFSLEVKTELSGIADNARHCKVAELLGLYDLIGRKEDECLIFESGSRLPLNVVSFLLKKLFDIDTEPLKDSSLPGRRMFALTLSGEKEGFYELITLFTVKRETKINLSCCKRAYIRGAFLAAGTIFDPEKAYQAEINCKDEGAALLLCNILNEMDIDARINKKKRYYSVYVKDGEGVCDLLGFMGARVTLLRLENAKIIKSMRGNVNRVVNCETANINKTAAASAHQIEDIMLIDSSIGISSLSNGLDELANLRLKYPEASLKELGEYFEPPIGKSAVNHRLRRLAKIAEELRAKEEHYYEE